MKIVLLLAIIGVCLYLGITQTAQMRKDAEAKAAAEAVEKAGPPTATVAAPASSPVTPAAASALSHASPQATLARATPAADATGATPAPKAGDWMWQKATPPPKDRRGR